MGPKAECLAGSPLKKQLNPKYLSSETRYVTTPPKLVEV